MVKLILMFLVVSVVPIAIVGYMSFSSAKIILREQFFNSLTTTAESREIATISYLRGKVGRIADFAVDGFVMDAVVGINQGDRNSGQLTEQLIKHLEQTRTLDEEIYESFILNTEGEIIVSTDKNSIGEDKSNDPYFINGKTGLYVKDMYQSEATGKIGFAVSAPLKSRIDNEFIGVIVNRYANSGLNEITTNREGMGETGEVYIVNRDGYMITESRFQEDVILKKKVDTEPVKLFQNQTERMHGIYPDFMGIPVVGASEGEHINDEFGLGWIILAEIGEPEAFAPIENLGFRIIWIAIFIGISVAIIALLFAKTIAGPLKIISEKIVSIVQGDLTVKMPSYKSQDEVGVLARSFGEMVHSLREQMEDIRDGANTLASSSNEILASTTQIASGTAQTATSISETSTTVEEVRQAAQLSSEKARSVEANAQQTAEAAKTGQKAIEETINEMDLVRNQMEAIANTIVNLSEQSQLIGGIIASVNDIADQSNLLAVNAAIEAAKAGEQGKGFSVVAQEIRNLAEQSKRATSQVRTILNDIQKATSAAVIATEKGSKAVDEGVTRSLQAGETIRVLAESSDESLQATIQISASSQQQLVGMNQIGLAMENINQAGIENAASMKQAENTAKELNALGEKLKQMVEQYKLQ